MSSPGESRRKELWAGSLTPHLHLCDRSRYERQHNNCKYARLLEYHSGLHGHGIRPKAQSIPLATGIYFHRGIAGIMEFSRNLDQAVEDPADKFPGDIRAIINHQVERYYRLIELRGLRVDEGEEYHTMKEQATLIEGLLWTWALVQLPFIRREFSVVSIEHEEATVIHCTCGLQDYVGELIDHRKRECQGVGWMSAADLILKRYADGEISWQEFKTSADPFKKGWVNSWSDNVQFVSGIVAAEARLEEQIGHYYVHGLAKGSRRSDYDKMTKQYSGPRRQASFLCYLYHRPANPPLEEEDFQAKFERLETDEITGETKKRRLTKQYLKQPVWDTDFPQRPSEMSQVEYWLNWLGKEELSSLIHVVGPYARPSHLIRQWLDEMPASERDWADRLWVLHEARGTASALHPEMSFEELELTPEVQLALRQNFPRNWSGCRGYYGDDCEYKPICYQEAGWDDPVGSGKFIYRRPHHQTEIDQMMERGIHVPDEEDAEEHEGASAE